jgi:hypothetical protein
VTSLHVPPQPEIDATRTALEPASNVIPLPPRMFRAHAAAAAAALDLAEHNRQLCVAAAALYVDTVRAALLCAAPERLTRDNVASLLDTLAQEIRKLALKDAS